MTAQYEIVRDFKYNDKILGDLVYATPAICQKSKSQSNADPESSQRLEGNMQGAIIDPSTNQILYELSYSQTRNNYFLGPGETVDDLDEESRRRYESSHELTLRDATYLAIPPDDSYTVGELLKVRFATDTAASIILELRIGLGELSGEIPHPALADGLIQYQLERRKQNPGQIFPAAKPPHPDTGEGRTE